ncbi:MAG: hypothetical protein JSV25_13305 [Spirochaetota bacterium]|nr:MAG: hypothetical protein JSV25_13305 [Spirochaetota bacterium]
MNRVKFVFICIFLALLFNPLFSAEVSEKQDIAIFGLTHYDHDIPQGVLGYTDSSINHIFINLKRFTVIGYGDYRLESKDINRFIERIKEIRSEKAKEAGVYDEKFGTIVIKGEDFDRIVNSFIVVIPSLSRYDVRVFREDVQVGFFTYQIENYEVTAAIDINFINVKEGTREESIRITGTSTDTNPDSAGTRAIESAVSMLSHEIRQLDAFKIKSGVIQVRGDTVYFELGGDIGVELGDEYEVMTRKKVGKTGRIAELPTGLVRVKKVYPDLSEAQIVFEEEMITEGDQLFEIARLGIEGSLWVGFMQVSIPDMYYDIIIQEDDGTEKFSMSLNQNKTDYAIDAGLRVTKSLGYNFKGVLDATAILNLPLIGLLGELGAGAALHLRRFSFELLAQGGFLYMTTFQKSIYNWTSPFDYIIIEGTPIYNINSPVMSIYGLAVGIKGGVGVTYLINPDMSLRAGINYRLYTPIRNWSILIEETAGSMHSVTIDSESPNVVESAESEGMKQVDISGFEINLSFNLRF